VIFTRIVCISAVVKVLNDFKYLIYARVTNFYAGTVNHKLVEIVIVVTLPQLL